MSKANSSPSSSRWPALASVVAAAVGIICTALLTAQHYRIAEKGIYQKSFCTISSLIDCDAALNSAYSHFWRIPNSELGLLFYVVVAIFGLWAAVSSERRASIGNFLLLLTGPGLAYSLYMAYLLFIKLEVICIFCTASHVMTLLLFIFAWVLSDTNPVKYITSTFGKEAKKTSLFQYSGVVGGVFVGGLLFLFGLNPAAHSGPAEFDAQALLNHFYQQEVQTLDSSNHPTWGPADAPVTVTDFSDFQCPSCKRAAFSLKPYLSAYKKQVKIVYRHYPLSSSCNPAMKQDLHANACLAAKTSYCVFKHKGNDAFWAYHDLVFENQKSLSHTLLTETLAAQVNMPTAELNACLTDPTTDEYVTQDVTKGNEIKIRGTPSIYINGRYLRAWVVPEVLRTVIEAELKRIK